MGFLYKLDFASGKSYIGITTQLLSRRVCGHRSCAVNGRPHTVYHAWRKHGTPTVTLLAELPPDLLEAAEVAAIERFQTLAPKGYNQETGGYLNKTLSTETRAKIAAKAVGRIASDETRQKMSAASKGRSKSEEMRRKLSAWHTGRALSDETKAKIRAKKIGTTASDEARVKMSLSRKGRKMSFESRAKNSASHIGKKHSPETIAKLTGKVRSKEHCARISSGKRAANLARRLKQAP